MPRLKGSADLLEDRRKRALALLDSGYSLNEVGRRIGCNASSVMRWRNARRRRGAEGLRVRSSPGRPLNDSHRCGCRETVRLPIGTSDADSARK